MPDLVMDARGNDLSYRIIGAAMAVHNALGPGYKEEVYERALETELCERDTTAMWWETLTRGQKDATHFPGEPDAQAAMWWEMLTRQCRRVLKVRCIYATQQQG